MSDNPLLKSGDRDWILPEGVPVAVRLRGDVYFEINPTYDQSGELSGDYEVIFYFDYARDQGEIVLAVTVAAPVHGWPGDTVSRPGQGEETGLPALRWVYAHHYGLLDTGFWIEVAGTGLACHVFQTPDLGYRCDVVRADDVMRNIVSIQVTADQIAFLEKCLALELVKDDIRTVLDDIDAHAGSPDPANSRLVETITRESAEFRQLEELVTAAERAHTALLEMLPK